MSGLNKSASPPWPKVRVGKVLTLVNGRAFKPTEWTKAGIPIVRIQNLNNPEASFNYYDGDLPQKFLLSDEDLLFAWSGTPGTSFGAHIWRGGSAWLNQHIFRVDFDEALFDRRFLQLAINQNLSDYIRAAHGAAGLAHITKGKFEDSQLPIPSLEEQRFVVAEIEKQFTRLEAGVAALKRVQANLKRYRAAVLKAACEGRLVPTEADLARQEGRAYETGEQLLARILNERRRTWRGRGKYKAPAAPITEHFQYIPAGWAWSTVEQLGIIGEQTVLTGPFGTCLGRQDFTLTGIPLLTIACLKDTGIHLDKAAFVSESKAHELNRYRLKPGDLLFSRMASVGRAGIVGEALNGVLFNYHIMRLRLDPNAILAKYYMAFVRGSAQVERYIRDVNHGATRDGINTEQLLNMPVCLPPLAEQKRIVAEVERRLSVIEEQETMVAASLRRAARLRQSILQRAFEGRLVPTSEKEDRNA